MSLAVEKATEKQSAAPELRALRSLQSAPLPLGGAACSAGVPSCDRTCSASARRASGLRRRTWPGHLPGRRSVSSGAREFALSLTPKSEAEVRAVSAEEQSGRQLGDSGPEPGATSTSPRHQRGRGLEVTFPEPCPPGAIQRCSCPVAADQGPSPATRGPYLLPPPPFPIPPISLTLILTLVPSPYPLPHS